MTGRRVTERESDRKKHKDTLAEDVKAAEELGLSYEMYSAYKQTGYLKEYIRLQKAEKERLKGANIIESHIGGSSGGSKKNPYGDAKRMG